MLDTGCRKNGKGEEDSRLRLKRPLKLRRAKEDGPLRPRLPISPVRQAQGYAARTRRVRVDIIRKQHAPLILALILQESLLFRFFLQPGHGGLPEFVKFSSSTPSNPFNDSHAFMRFRHRSAFVIKLRRNTTARQACFGYPPVLRFSILGRWLAYKPNFLPFPFRRCH